MLYLLSSLLLGPVGIRRDGSMLLVPSRKRTAGDRRRLVCVCVCVCVACDGMDPTRVGSFDNQHRRLGLTLGVRSGHQLPLLPLRHRGTATLTIFLS